MDLNLTWVQYPQELINHAILHALRKKEFDLKMSMVLIDNAVEIIMKEYLSQPSTCFSAGNPTYREVKDCLNNFHALVDLCIKYKPDIMDASDINVISRFHDIRNLMYHNGSGITVSIEIVDQYIDVAKLLFFGLYSRELVVDEESQIEQELGIYLKTYADFISYHRRSLKERNKDEMAFYWKTKIFEIINPALAKVYLDCQSFHMSITGVDPDRDEFKRIPEYIKKIELLHSEVSRFVNDVARYDRYLKEE